MRVIMLKDVKNVGKKGDVIDVSDGYARNYLIPSGLAVLATKEKIKEYEEKKIAEENFKRSEKNKLREIARNLEGKIFEIKAKEKRGKLFGSIGKKEIAIAIGSNISEDMINLRENIKEVGEKSVEIVFDKDIKSCITVKIIGEQDPIGVKK